VGGGCGEADVWRTALAVLADGEPRTVVVDLTEAIAMTTDGVCGGIMNIFVERWATDASPARERAGSEFPSSTPELALGILEAMKAKRRALTITVVGRSSTAPAALGANLLVVDGEPRVGDLGSPALLDRVLTDVPEVTALGRSGMRTYDVSDGPLSSTRGRARCAPSPASLSWHDTRRPATGVLYLIVRPATPFPRSGHGIG
jgi:xanthine/CO dehydrogenase XdhC/CoxF family maturation factor